jgi:methionyl-tRNA synthetase
LTVHHFWNLLVNKGFIGKGYHEGWYSVSDETFVTETAVEERHDSITGNVQRYSKESGHILQWIKEENYKFPLSRFQAQLLTWLHSHRSVIRPVSRYNEICSFLEEKDLNDLSISRLRSRLQWGWMVPGDEAHTIYVWFDALLNYLTVAGYPWDSKSPTNSFFPPDYHIIGKDILKFHAVYWPAFLLAGDIALPKTIVTHAHWTVNATKMSKSLGNVVDPFQILDDYGVDPVRYFLLREGPLNDDVDFSVSAMIGRINSDLADQLGNLLSRSLTPSFYQDACLPNCGPLDNIDYNIIQQIQQLPSMYFENPFFFFSLILILISVSIRDCT